MDKSEIPAEQLMESFVMYQEDQNHTPKTVGFYPEKLNRFLRVLGEAAKPRDLSIEAGRRYQWASREKTGARFSQHAWASATSSTRVIPALVLASWRTGEVHAHPGS